VNVSIGMFYFIRTDSKKLIFQSIWKQSFGCTEEKECISFKPWRHTETAGIKLCTFQPVL